MKESSTWFRLKQGRAVDDEFARASTAREEGEEEVELLLVCCRDAAMTDGLCVEADRDRPVTYVEEEGASQGLAYSAARMAIATTVMVTPRVFVDGKQRRRT